MTRLRDLWWLYTFPIRRRIARKARADAAKRGQRTYWQKAGRQGRETFG